MTRSWWMILLGIALLVFIPACGGGDTNDDGQSETNGQSETGGDSDVSDLETDSATSANDLEPGTLCYTTEGETYCVEGDQVSFSKVIQDGNVTITFIWDALDYEKYTADYIAQSLNCSTYSADDISKFIADRQKLYYGHYFYLTFPDGAEMPYTGSNVGCSDPTCVLRYGCDWAYASMYCQGPVAEACYTCEDDDPISNKAIDCNYDYRLDKSVETLCGVKHYFLGRQHTCQFELTDYSPTKAKVNLSCSSTTGESVTIQFNAKF